MRGSMVLPSRGHRADGKRQIRIGAPLAYPIGGETEMEEGYFGFRRKGNRGRGAAGRVSSFGYLERNGKPPINIVPDAAAQILVGPTDKTFWQGNSV